jgi:hypothetical protein
VWLVAASDAAVGDVDEAELLRELLQRLGDVRLSDQINRVNYPSMEDAGVVKIPCDNCGYLALFDAETLGIRGLWAQGREL